MREFERWIAQQEASLVQKVAGLTPAAVDWEKVAPLFKAQFRSQRALQGFKGKVRQPISSQQSPIGQAHSKAKSASKDNGGEAHGLAVPAHMAQ